MFLIYLKNCEFCFDRTDDKGDAEFWCDTIGKVILSKRIAKYRESLDPRESCFPMEFFKCS